MASVANRRARRCFKQSHLKVLTYARELIIALLLVTGANAKHNCHKDQYTVVYSNGTIGCENCDHCDEGQAPSPPCGTRISETTKRICELCKQGISFKEHSGLSSCERCSPPCAKGQTVLQECTAKTNVKCGKSCYEQHMYFDAEKGCLPCSVCCGGDGTVQDECKKKLGAKSNRICSFNSTGTACSSTTKQTPFTRVTTKTSSMQENGHPKKHKAIIPVIIFVALSGSLVLILLAVVFVRRRSSRRRSRHYVRPDIHEGGGATPLQTADKVWKENSKLLKTLLEQEDVLQRICLALDNDKPSWGNCNRVAQECGYSPNEIALMKKSPNGATMALIEALSVTKPDMTIQEFIDAAVKPSKRNDVAKLLMDFDHDRPEE